MASPGIRITISRTVTLCGIGSLVIGLTTLAGIAIADGREVAATAHLAFAVAWAWAFVTVARRSSRHA